MYFWIYILTLSLQLSGSLLLLISSFGKVKSKVINDCIGGSKGLISKNNIIDIGEDSVKSSLQAIYLNRGSFIMLSVGYLLSIFDSYQIVNCWIVLGTVIICTAIISIFNVFVANRLAKDNAEKYSKIQTEDLTSGTIFYEEY